MDAEEVIFDDRTKCRELVELVESLPSSCMYFQGTENIVPDCGVYASLKTERTGRHEIKRAVLSPRFQREIDPFAPDSAVDVVFRRGFQRFQYQGMFYAVSKTMSPGLL
jgi:hypothetical protein